MFIKVNKIKIDLAHSVQLIRSSGTFLHIKNLKLAAVLIGMHCEDGACPLRQAACVCVCV